jgi:hypothetical protein
MKYIVIIFILFSLDKGISQVILEEQTKIYDGITGIMNTDSIRKNICDKSMEALGFADSIENADTGKTNINKLYVSLIKAACYFCMTSEYLKSDSYEYGIQVLEKGIDNLKIFKILFRKLYSGNIPDIKIVNKLYDECFNTYTKYKMAKNKNENIDMPDLLKKHLNKLAGNEYKVLIHLITGNE